LAGNLYFQPNSVATLLDDTGAAGNASLTTLAAGSAVITTSPGIDNTSRLDYWADFELTIYFGSAPTAGQTVDLYLLESADGTNYADGTAGSSPVTVQTHFVGSFPVRAVTTIQRVSLRGVPLPPLKTNVQLVNNTSQAFAAQSTGSRLKVVTYREQYS
jgi:hypothetical protein